MSISQQIRAALAKTAEPMTTQELLDQCDEAQSTTDIAASCYAMHKAGTLTRERAEGSNRYQYRLAAGARVDEVPNDDDDTLDASEARASRATSSRKPSGPGPQREAQTTRARRSVALLPVTGKAPPPRPGPSATGLVEADLQIAITEAGVLALRRGELVLYLSPEEQARIEAFRGRFKDL